MKRRIFGSAAIVLLVLPLILAATAAEQRGLAAKLTRLHVIANSDSAADQALKLKVRDAVLDFAEGIDEKALLSSLDKIRSIAEETVRAEGYNYNVTVELGAESYGTRVYDSFALPAGSYRSLRISIGTAEGENWWCVLFPPLCFASSEDFDDCARSAGLSSEQIIFVKKNGQDIQIRFRILELVQKVAHFFSD